MINFLDLSPSFTLMEDRLIDLSLASAFKVRSPLDVRFSENAALDEFNSNRLEINLGKDSVDPDICINHFHKNWPQDAGRFVDPEGYFFHHQFEIYERDYSEWEGDPAAVSSMPRFDLFLTLRVFRKLGMPSFEDCRLVPVEKPQHCRFSSKQGVEVVHWSVAVARFQSL